MTRRFGHPGQVAGQRVVGRLSDDPGTPWERSVATRRSPAGPWENDGRFHRPSQGGLGWKSDAPDARGEVLHEVVRAAILADQPGDLALGVVDRGVVASPEP